MKNAISITQSTDGLPAARVQVRDTDEMQGILTTGVPTVYSASLDLPDGLGILTVDGEVTNYTVTPGDNGILMELEVIESSSIHEEVYLGVVHAQELLPDLQELYDEDKSLRYTAIPNASSGALAREITSSGGMVLHWDTRLNYPVVSLLEPVFIFKGTIIDGLRELLEPFNVAGHKFYSFVIDGDTISVHYIGVGRPGYITPTPLVFGVDTHVVGAPTISETLPTGATALDYWWCEPTEVKEETVVASQSKSIGGDGSPILIPLDVYSETVTKTTVLGGLTLSVRTETDKKQFGIWATDSVEITEYFYDPAPTPENIFYRADRRLVELKTSVEYYRVLTSLEGGYSSEWYKTEVKDIFYAYLEGSNVLESETTKEYVERDETELAFEGTVTEKSYKAITPSVVQITDKMTSYTSTGGGTQSTAYEATQNITVQPGSPPSPPVATVNTNVLSKTFSGSIAAEDRFSGTSDSVGFPFNPESMGLIDDLRDRMESRYMRCSLTVKSNYDIKPGGWVSFVFPEDCTYTTYCQGVEVIIKLSDIFALLPSEMRVNTVEVSKNDTETVCNLNLEGWKLG